MAATDASVKEDPASPPPASAGNTMDVVDDVSVGVAGNTTSAAAPSGSPTKRKGMAIGIDQDEEEDEIAVMREKITTPLRAAAAPAPAMVVGADSDSDVAIKHSTRKPRGPKTKEEDADPVADVGVADSDSDATVRRPLRRSTRTRTKPKEFFPSVDNQAAGPYAPRSSTRRRARPGGRGAGPSNAADEGDDEESHLDQIALEEGGTLRMRVCPVAVSLMQLHVHLSKTEVIGYLGGFIMDSGVICVLEAFPANCVEPKEMTKTGRSAYREVEMKPESDVMLRAQIDSKGLAVVGWYHSHPDKKFTVEPSRVDIENQHNYQQWIFKGRPFVAVILAPYNEDLPDCVGAMDCFYVRSDDEVPLRVPYDIEYSNIDMGGSPTNGNGNGNSNGNSSHDLTAYRSHLNGKLMADDALEHWAIQLIMDGAKYRQRVHLLSEWRDGMRFVDKMVECMVKLLPDTIPEGITTGDNMKDSAQLVARTNNDRLNVLFKQLASLTESVWPESPQKKTAAAKKKRRKRNR